MPEKLAGHAGEGQSLQANQERLFDQFRMYLAIGRGLSNNYRVSAGHSLETFAQWAYTSARLTRAGQLRHKHRASWCTRLAVRCHDKIKSGASRCQPIPAPAGYSLMRTSTNSAGLHLVKSAIRPRSGKRKSGTGGAAPTEPFEQANVIVGGLFAVIALNFTLNAEYGMLGSTDNTVRRLFTLNYWRWG